jgi:hypothetical protein
MAGKASTQNTNMKNYSLVMPSLDGLLSDDALYFEGVSRPAEYYIFRDTPSSTGDPVILERYSNDVYNLFLRKLSLFASDNNVGEEDSIKLQALLQELIKVKGLIAGKGEAAS